uniref:Uncharacterized protein n=1 Tax=Glossina austeni TaxID=7395 RepID=A0A1A9VGR1_GLOAU
MRGLSTVYPPPRTAYAWPIHRLCRLTHRLRMAYVPPRLPLYTAYNQLMHRLCMAYVWHHLCDAYAWPMYRLGIPYTWLTTAYASLMRGLCMARPMRCLCMAYVPPMHPLSIYPIHGLCTAYVWPMYRLGIPYTWLTTAYASLMRGLCMARPMRCLCMAYVPPMHPYTS